MGSGFHQFLAIVASYLGFALIALAMPRNCQLIMATRVPAKLSARARRGRQLAGSALLLLSLAFAVGGNGPGFGFPVWVLVLSLGAFGTMATLSWAPTRLRWLGHVAGDWKRERREER